MATKPGERAAHLASELDYPMVIVTAAAGGQRAGCLVGFSSQCSLDPFRLAVWISRSNRTYEVAKAASLLAVHYPDASQRGLAALFGEVTGDDEDKFARCRWSLATGEGGGAVILDDCARRLVGRVVSHHDGGDHEGFVLEAVQVETGDWSGPLNYQMVKDLHPGHPRTTHG